MDVVKPVLVGTPAIQGPIQPGATPLPGATSGLFGSGGNYSPGAFQQLAGGFATVGGAYGAIQSGRIVKDQFNLEASSQQLQANVIKNNALEQTNMLRKKLLMDLGSANASAAARGLDVGSGTPRQVQIQSIGEVERTAAKVKSGANIDSQSANISASRTRAKASTKEAAGYYRAARGLGNYIMDNL